MLINTRDLAIIDHVEILLRIIPGNYGRVESVRVQPVLVDNPAFGMEDGVGNVVCINIPAFLHAESACFCLVHLPA